MRYNCPSHAAHARLSSRILTRYLVDLEDKSLTLHPTLTEPISAFYDTEGGTEESGPYLLLKLGIPDLC